MADVKRVRTAAKAPVRNARAQQPQPPSAGVQPRAPRPEAKRLLETPLVEPSRAELNSISKLLFDANLCLNGYLEALKASSGGSQQSYGGGDAKGVGAA